MADHGTATSAVFIDVHDPEEASAYGTSLFPLVQGSSAGASGTIYNVLDTRTAQGYLIAGTIDNSYRPPTVGQLWPRGDLDALV